MDYALMSASTHSYHDEIMMTRVTPPSSAHRYEPIRIRTASVRPKTGPEPSTPPGS